MFTFSAFFNKTLAISLALGLKFGKKDFEKYVMKTFTPINLLLITIITFTNLFAQQNERDRGIELYKKGNTVEAIQILEILSKNKEGKNDGEVWNYLGLAYLNENKNKDARNSFEKAIKLNPQSSAFHSNLAYAFLLERKVNKAQNVIKKALEINPQNANAYFIRGTADLWEGKFESAVADAEKSISVNPQFTSSYILKSDGLLHQFGDLWQKTDLKPIGNIELLSQAVEILNLCLETCPKDESLKIVSERKETVKAFYDYFKKQGSNAQTSTANLNNSTFKILTKPRALYTDSARQAGVQGTITLAVVFTSDAKISHVIVLKGLGNGLNENALRAARNITFAPETENGKPISVVKMLQFSFSIY